MGTFGIGEEGGGETKKGDSAVEGGRKDRTFASCPMGAATVSCKDL